MKLTKLAVATVFTASVVSFSAMADNTGTINFVGTVVNTPCNIEQSSLKQTVDFGQLSRKALESGKPAEAEFEIKFTGCDFANFGKDTEGNPVAVKSMELVFTGQSYADKGNTLLATSAGNSNNLGILIDGFEFGKATDVLPRIANTNGENTLIFKALAKAVDTTKDVAEGRFSAISNFRITYQ
ncbi:fimbrial protein [Providencia stuartii]|uniref:fimbrial protein n=1 Tax=Providencia stuartii TaxID=588 RepID=UPI0004F6B3F3|nr:MULTISPECIES: fimbrial protein [Providencia]AIN62487.1 fimbrial family protein [Providencia stuartii]MBG5896172.1 type 1 fimbrial protein [Providencia stuartii]MBK1418902.1 type 1 fimbrial protein [Providencia stuartii]MDT2042814.1 fimbrial protein [Providencia stuartii]MTC11519.1 fimbrial protein [Providencia stuartii]